MNVLLVVPQDEEIGGVASVVGNLARYLTSRGHRVLFFHPAVGVRIEGRINRLGFPSFYLRLQMPFGARQPVVSLLVFLILFPIIVFQLLLMLRRQRIEIINVHYPADYLVYFAFCQRVLGLPLVTSIHGAEVFPDGKPQVSYSRAMKFLFSSSNSIVAPSMRFQQDFLTVFSEFRAKVVVIHNGINLAEFGADCGKSADGHEDCYILSVSAYKEQKAIDVLIRAFKTVHEAHPLARLVLVGAGPLREPLQDLAVTLGIHDQIEFLGPKTRSEVASLMRGCEVFVLPSRFETFGIVILEAMACNKPVIGTTAGGIPEIIDNGDNGILVAPGDATALAQALITILIDKDLPVNLATNGQRTVRERFDCEKTGSKYETLFTGLVDRAS